MSARGSPLRTPKPREKTYRIHSNSLVNPIENIASILINEDKFVSERNTEIKHSTIYADAPPFYDPNEAERLETYEASKKTQRAVAALLRQRKGRELKEFSWTNETLREFEKTRDLSRAVRERDDLCVRLQSRRVKDDYEYEYGLRVRPTVKRFLRCSPANNCESAACQVCARKFQLFLSQSLGTLLTREISWSIVSLHVPQWSFEPYVVVNHFEAAQNWAHVFLKKADIALTAGWVVAYPYTHRPTKSGRWWVVLRLIVPSADVERLPEALLASCEHLFRYVEEDRGPLVQNYAIWSEPWNGAASKLWDLFEPFPPKCVSDGSDDYAGLTPLADIHHETLTRPQSIQLAVALGEGQIATRLVLRGLRLRNSRHGVHFKGTTDASRKLLTI